MSRGLIPQVSDLWLLTPKLQHHLSGLIALLILIDVSWVRIKGGLIAVCSRFLTKLTLSLLKYLYMFSDETKVDGEPIAFDHPTVTATFTHRAFPSNVCLNIQRNCSLFVHFDTYVYVCYLRRLVIWYVTQIIHKKTLKCY